MHRPNLVRNPQNSLTQSEEMEGKSEQWRLLSRNLFRKNSQLEKSNDAKVKGKENSGKKKSQ